MLRPLGCFEIRRNGKKIVIGLIFEAMTGSLEKLVSKSKLSEKKERKLFQAMILAYKPLWEMGIVMRDIKPGNYLYKKINGKYLVKLADL